MEKSSCHNLPGSTPQVQVNGVTELEENIRSASHRPIIGPALEELGGHPQSPQSILRRSLKVPARGDTLLLGFKIPPTLASAGVSKEQWHMFTKEIKNLIDPHQKREWAVYLTLGFGIVLNPVTLVPVTYLVRERHKDRDRRSFDDKKSNGELKQCTDRWNLAYFEPLGLHAVVDAPDSSLVPSGDSGDANHVDVASTKLFKYHQKLGIVSHPELDHKVSLRKETVYKAREPRDRAIAAKKFSIMVWPLSSIPPETRKLQDPNI